jgi:Protein of unknown function (DUF3306)
MSRPEDDGGFLGRWSKRKQAVQLEAKQELKTPAEPIQQALVDRNSDVSVTQEEEKEEVSLPLPSLDDILPGGDVSVFLQKHVPDSLRNLALRKAWAMDPEISGFIEMAENQWDFNNPDSIPGFSSKLEGIDLKAMVDKVFNNVAPLEKEEPEEELIEANLDENTSQEAISDTSEFIIMDTKSSQNAENTAMNREKMGKTDSFVATQKNTVKSDGYEPDKRRHGSALPS